LSPVNLLLLATLEERSTHGKFDCFLEIEDRDSLEDNDLANEAAGDVFALFWKAVVLPAVEAFPCF